MACRALLLWLCTLSAGLVDSVQQPDPDTSWADPQSGRDQWRTLFSSPSSDRLAAEATRIQAALAMTSRKPDALGSPGAEAVSRSGAKTQTDSDTVAVSQNISNGNSHSSSELQHGFLSSVFSATGSVAQSLLEEARDRNLMQDSGKAVDIRRGDLGDGHLGSSESEKLEEPNSDDSLNCDDDGGYIDFPEEFPKVYVDFYCHSVSSLLCVPLPQWERRPTAFLPDIVSCLSSREKRRRMVYWLEMVVLWVSAVVLVTVCISSLPKIGACCGAARGYVPVSPSEGVLLAPTADAGVASRIRAAAGNRYVVLLRFAVYFGFVATVLGVAVSHGWSTPTTFLRWEVWFVAVAGLSFIPVCDSILCLAVGLTPLPPNTVAKTIVAPLVPFIGETLDLVKDINLGWVLVAQGGHLQVVGWVSLGWVVALHVIFAFFSGANDNFAICWAELTIVYGGLPYAALIRPKQAREVSHADEEPNASAEPGARELPDADGSGTLAETVRAEPSKNDGGCCCFAKSRVDQVAITLFKQCLKIPLIVLEDLPQATAAIMLAMGSGRLGTSLLVVNILLPVFRILFCLIAKQVLRQRAVPYLNEQASKALASKAWPELGVLLAELGSDAQLTNPSDEQSSAELPREIFEGASYGNVIFGLRAAIERGLRVTVAELDFSDPNVHGELDANAKLLQASVSLMAKNSGCGDRVIKAVSQIMKASASIQSLDWRCSNVGDDGARDIAEMIRDLASLRYVDLRRNAINLRGIRHLFEVVKVGGSIETLRLWNATIGGKDSEWPRPRELNGDGFDLLEALVKVDKSIHSLDLAGYDLKDEGARQVARVIKASTFQRADLSGNRIGNQGAEYLLEALKGHTPLRNLYLKGNKIGLERRQQLTRELTCFVHF